MLIYNRLGFRYCIEENILNRLRGSIKNGDQPLPRVTQVSIAGTTSTEQPALKDRLARSLLIQGLPNDIYSLINSNKTAKDLWDVLARHMLGSEYGEQDKKATVLYEYETFKATKGELLLDTYIQYLQFLNNLQPEWKQYATMMRQNKNLMDINIDALYNILKQKQGDVNDAMGSKKKTIVVTSDPLALTAEKTNVSRSKEKVVVSLDSEGSETDDFNELIKIIALLAKEFNRRKFYSKPTNNNLRTSYSSQSANKNQEFVKTDNKRVKKKDDEKKRDMSIVKCYNRKKEGHFAKDCKKVKVKDNEYYKTKMLLSKKDKDEQVILAEDQAWMESSKASSSSADEKNSEMSRDVLTVGSTIRIPLLYQGEYSQWVKRFMNYLEEQTDGEAMINSIKNGDQPLPRVTQVSIAGTTSTEQPPLIDKSIWSNQEKRVQKIDRLARSLLIQGLLNDIYSLIDSNKTAKDLWDTLARHMLGSEYGEQDRKDVVLYKYETFKAIEGELLLDTYIRYLQVINDLKKCGYSKYNCELNFKFLNNLQPEWKKYATMMRQNKNLMDINIDALHNILKQNQGDVNDVIGSKKKIVVVTYDPLTLIAEKTNVSRSKEKVVVSSDSEG
nr:hypothetical protein [Tanacetum cinerariifolium]